MEFDRGLAQSVSCNHGTPLHTCSSHDDVIKWKLFPRYWPSVGGVHRSPGIPLIKGSDMELWCFFDLRLNKRLSKIREVSDFRCHRAHFDVSVMFLKSVVGKTFPAFPAHAHPAIFKYVVRGPCRKINHEKFNFQSRQTTFFNLIPCYHWRLITDNLFQTNGRQNSKNENTTLSLRLTHWGRVTYICVGNLTIIDSDNGLSPGRRQAIIWTNAGILLIGPLGTNFSEILIGIQIFSFKKMRLKMSSAKWRPFCLGHNVLTQSLLWLTC